MKNVKSIWISYDLQNDADYSHLYEWMQNHNAQECGNSIAFLKYEYESTEDFEDALKEDIATKIPEISRCYVIFRKDDEIYSRGCFIIGDRKNSPWKK